MSKWFSIFFLFSPTYLSVTENSGFATLKHYAIFCSRNFGPYGRLSQYFFDFRYSFHLSLWLKIGILSPGDVISKVPVVLGLIVKCQNDFLIYFLFSPTYLSITENSRFLLWNIMLFFVLVILGLMDELRNTFSIFATLSTCLWD